jgi:HPt (histidine-containing phosphotransfer) domain-containing protein
MARADFSVLNARNKFGVDGGGGMLMKPSNKKGEAEFAMTQSMAVIDVAQLCEILGERDPDELGSHLDMFFTHFPTQIERIEAALATENLADLVVIAHTAKGAAGMAAATRLCALLQEIESTATQGADAGTALRTLVMLVRPEYARVQSFVESGGLHEIPPEDAR